MKQNPVLTFGGGLTLFSIILLILAMSGLFFPVIILPLTVAFFASGLTALFFFWKSISGKEKTGFISIAIFIIGATSFSHVEPSVFTGRDQGSISIAAIELAENRELAFALPIATDFFAIYRKGAALHFPGFFYTDTGSLITQFPLGYTAFLASFFQTFGLIGLTLGNDILLLASLMTLFALLQKLAPKITWLGMTIFAMSLVPIFLVHLTLTENLALFLFLFLSLRFMEFFRNKSTMNYFGVLLPAILLPFVRVEGFAFLGMTVLILALTKEVRQFIRKKLFERCLLPVIFFMALLVASFFANNPFYHVIGKEILKSLPTTASSGGTISAFAFPMILSLYGVLPILLAGCIGIAIIIRSKKWILLLPALLAFPTFIYLLSPNITPDHPWMLRRFLFSVWPALLLTLLFTLNLLLETKKLTGSIASILLILILLGQTPAFFSLVPLKNSALLPQVASFADHLSPTDRILIDRETTGDGFTMISGPLASLFHMDAAYFFNPLDMKKLTFHEGQTTYLLAPEKKIPFYEKNMPDFMLIPKRHVSFTTHLREALPITVTRFPLITPRSQINVLLEVVRK